MYSKINKTSVTYCNIFLQVTWYLCVNHCLYRETVNLVKPRAVWFLVQQQYFLKDSTGIVIVLGFFFNLLLATRTCMPLVKDAQQMLLLGSTNTFRINCKLIMFSNAISQFFTFQNLELRYLFNLTTTPLPPNLGLKSRRKTSWIEFGSLKKTFSNLAVKPPFSGTSNNKWKAF